MKAELVLSFCSLLLLCIGQRTAVADRYSGCPSYGCLPSGTFALSSDIPGGTGKPVGTRWTSLVSNNGQLGEVSEHGCLSCQEGVVCATRSGYVSVDQQKGDIVWRYDNMTSPSLPVLDIYGDVIGTDGRHLVKIDASGKVQKPIIKIYDDLNPMYSIMLTNDDLMLMTSHAEGLLITYGTDGIPEASFPLRAEVQRVNGSFLPVAQPVIYGMRAYILAQFVPDMPVPQSQAQVLGLQRLYAVDLWRRMTERISPVWYVNFERESKCSHGTSPSSSFSSSSSSSFGNSVLVHNDTVYVSLGGPQSHCGGVETDARGSGRQGSGEAGMLWAIRDNGTDPEVLFKTPAPVSDLALYDVTIGHQRLPSWEKELSRFYHGPQLREGLKQKAKKTHGTTSSSPSAPTILWTSTTSAGQITGHDPKNGSITHLLNVAKLLNLNNTGNTSCTITSKLMVTRSPDGKQERLVFAVTVSEDADTKRTATSSRFGRVVRSNNSSSAAPFGRVVSSNSSTPYVVAVNVDLLNATQNVQVLWKIAGQPGTKIVGQIPNMLFVPPATKKGKGEEGGEEEGEGERDDVEVVLVATAVSEHAQFSFAVGHV